MELDCTHSIRCSPWPRDANPLVAFFDILLGWIERGRQRRALGRLDARMLADIGIDRASAMVEVGKPFWRP